MWHSLNTPCLGRGGVFKHIMDKRDGGRVAKCITESERLRECNVSKHYAGVTMACLNRVLMESGEREGVKRVSVLFRRGVCALSAH